MNGNTTGNSARDDRTKEGFVVKPSNIRIWIHDEDIGKLTKVLWAGQGNRLRAEISNNPRVRKFLEAVPHILNVIRDLHQAVIEYDLEIVQLMMAPRSVPRSMITSKDHNGLTVMHKAAGLGHAMMVEYLLEIWPDGVTEIDGTGKTPLHWAASAKNNSRCYNLLVQAGAYEDVLDYKMKVPLHYKMKPGEIDRSLLTVVPDAPRIPRDSHPDWSALMDDNAFDFPRVDHIKNRFEGRDSDDFRNGVRSRYRDNSIENTSEPDFDDGEGKMSVEEEALRAAVEEEKIIEETADDVQVANENVNGNDVFSRGESPLPADEVISNSTENEQNNENPVPDEEINLDDKPEEELPEQEQPDPELDKTNDDDLSAKTTEGEDQQNGIEDSIDKEGDNDDGQAVEENIIEDQGEKQDEDIEKPENDEENDSKTKTPSESKDVEEDIQHTGGDGENEEANKEEYGAKENADFSEGPALSDNNEDPKEETKNNKENEVQDENNGEVQTENTEEIQVGCIENDHDKEEAPDESTVQNREDNEHEEQNHDEQISKEKNYGDTEENEKKEKVHKNILPNGDQNDIKEIHESVTNGVDGEEDDDDQVGKIDPVINGFIDEDLEIRSGNTHEGSPSPALEIQGVVQGEPDDNQVQSEGGIHQDDESRIKSIISAGDMEQLAALVLNGEGKKLLGSQSSQSEIQAFLDNVRAYMSKIRRVHRAAKEGNLRELQAALDRRKFAIAKDQISPNGASPLHVATIFGHAGIVRYLGGRFPETTSAVDDNGRTALHYAATINDNGHFYNLLTHLGSNPKATDKLGNTAEFYRNQEQSKNIFSHKQLLTDFGAEESLEEKMLSDQGKTDARHLEIPLFRSEQGQYLASTLGDPLIKGLTEIVEKRPSDPVAYLAAFLHNYSKLRTKDQDKLSTGANDIFQKASVPVKTDAPQREDMAPTPDVVDSSAEDRDEHGQSLLHFACARSHGRNGLFRLIEESGVNITYRDELYRTARDVSLQASQPANAKDIDRYVISLAARGDLKAFEDLVLEGYDHILDLTDDQSNSINDVARKRGFNNLTTFLEKIQQFEENREELHQAIRSGNMEKIEELTSSPDGARLVQAKNYYGRTALHIAVIKENEEIVEHMTNIAPAAIKIGDNLERTPLHYAMGVNAVETISRILIRKGAKRTDKDLKGRQPTYYFMNRADILRLQEEEEEGR